MLLVERPEMLTARIKQLRTQYHFRTRLRRSTNKFQLDFAKKLLDYFFKEPDLRFAARVLTERTAQNETQSYRNELYKFHYKQFLRDNFPTGKGVVITLIKTSRFAADRVLQELRSEISLVEQINVVSVSSNDILQMTGFIARYVCGEAPNPAALSNHTKVEILHDLRSRLGVATLLDPSLSRKRKFRIQTG